MIGASKREKEWKEEERMIEEDNENNYEIERDGEEERER